VRYVRHIHLRADSALPLTYHLQCARIPELHFVRGRSDRDLIAVAPRDARDDLLFVDADKVLDLGGARVPQVHGASERDGEHVVAAPRQQVQIVVVHNVCANLKKQKKMKVTCA
jgi:hypothetical protein